MVVRVTDDEPSRCQGEDRYMPVDFVVVEGWLVMDHEVDQFLITHGDHDRVLDELGKVPARVYLCPQLPACRP